MSSMLIVLLASMIGIINGLYIDFNLCIALYFLLFILVIIINFINLKTEEKYNCCVLEFFEQSFNSKVSQNIKENSNLKFISNSKENSKIKSNFKRNYKSNLNSNFKSNLSKTNFKLNIYKLFVFLCISLSFCIYTKYEINMYDSRYESGFIGGEYEVISYRRRKRVLQ